MFLGNRPGTKKNLMRAFELFMASSDQGLGMAMYNVADFYYRGKGGVVRQDLDKAYQLARDSIKDPRVEQRRQADPYYMLGMMLFKVSTRNIDSSCEQRYRNCTCHILQEIQLNLHYRLLVSSPE